MRTSVCWAVRNAIPAYSPQVVCKTGTCCSVFFYPLFLGLFRLLTFLMSPEIKDWEPTRKEHDAKMMECPPQTLDHIP